jgi:hypothetical protein
MFSFYFAGIDVGSDTIFKAIPIVLGLATSIYKFRDARPRRRKTLEADLALLKTAREQKLACDEFETYIQEELVHLYRRTTETQWGWVLFGSLFALWFGVWTGYVLKDGFSWWALLTGFFTFVGISLVMTGLEDSRRVEDRGRATQRAPEPSGS